MRTKFYLAALCLPLAFTACTNEDLMTEETPLPLRQKINVTLTAEKPVVGADSRLDIDEENNFLWEKDVDMIGAALTDGAALGTPANNILVNYPFTADKSAKASTFSGKSSVTEGTYFFYYGYQDILDRGTLSLNVPAQVYDVDAEKSAKQQAISYMKMISPLVELEDGVSYEDAQGYNLPLEFVNLYTLVRVNIDATNIPEGVTPKVTKVSLNETAGSGFIKTATADIATNIAAAGISGFDNDGEWEADAYATNLETLATKVETGAIYATTGATYGATAVTVDGDLPLSETSATDVYLLVPKNTYSKLELKVETSEGTYTREIDATSAPIEFGDNVRALAANLDFAQDGSGNVVLPGTFSIASSTDWNDAVKFMTDHAVGYLNKTVSFNLTKSITIANMPIFNLAITGTPYEYVDLATGVKTAGTNPTLTLSSNYTIGDENYDQFTISNVKLGVASGATLTIKNSAVAFTEIVNQGTLNINTDAVVSTKIVNLATMNINGAATITTLQNGRAKSGSTVTKIEGTVNVLAGKKPTITTLASNAGTINVPATSELTVTNGTNKGTITVNGKLDGALTNTGTIDNFGTLAAVVNNSGTVKVESGSVSDNSTSVTGGTVVIVDVTDYSALQASQDRLTSHYVYGSPTTVTTIVNNGAEFDKANGCSEINDITLSTGTWKLKSSVATPSTANKDIVVPTNASSITLNAATLDLGGIALNKNINVSGSSAFASNAAVVVTGNLSMDANSSLTIAKGITMNAAAASNAYNATIKGTLTVNPGAAMYFNTVTVESAGVVTVMGNTNSANAAIFGVKTTFTNKGYVESKAGTHSTAASRVAGEVSQPTNTASGTFKGNATTIAFP